MEMIIAILIWARVMIADGQYTQTQYQELVAQNQEIIDQTLADAQLHSAIEQEYGIVASTVVIGEDN
jgi:hypothetical protein